jgi:hypothetical protein
VALIFLNIKKKEDFENPEMSDGLSIPLPEISDAGLKKLLEKHVSDHKTFDKYVTVDEPNTAKISINHIETPNIVEPMVSDKEKISKETTTQVIDEPYIAHSGKPSAQLPSQTFVINDITQTTDLK